MTLLGKILTVLVTVMSVLFMAFSMVVVATHTDWSEEVKGLDEQVKSWKDKNDQLQVELDGSKTALAREQAARRFAIATLQKEADDAEKDLDDEVKKIQLLQAAHATLQIRTRMANERLGMLTAELADLRSDIRQTINDRNNEYEKVVLLTDEFVGLRGTHDTLDSIFNKRTGDLTRARGHLESLGVRLENPLPDEPPRIRGLVTKVSDRDLIEISLGEDDGIRRGHELYVFRNQSYVARVVVRRVSVDFAVAEIIKEFSRSTVQKGDQVATKLS